MKERILCNASVELVRDIPRKTWEVTVWRMPPDGTQRRYTIQAESDTLAAQSCINIFVNECEAIRDASIEEI